MQSNRYLLDTNIWLRLSQSDSSSNEAVVSRAVEGLYLSGAQFLYTLQNAAEFWNVCTRPKENNGFGMSLDAADRQLHLLETGSALLPDTEAVFQYWRNLIVKFGVKGRQVHDAHLVASMLAHRVPALLTLNTIDFARYADLMIAVHPQDVPG